MTLNAITCADALTYLQSLPDESVHCMVTSPPYWALRSYLADDHPDKIHELGLEPTLTEYLSNMTAIFTEARRVLRSDGNLWLNMGQGYQNKQLDGQAWRLAFRLQDDGWVLRSDIIWAKKNPMPASVTDRPTTAHEYIFLLTKSPRYWYDAYAIREAHKRLWDERNGGNLSPNGVHKANGEMRERGHDYPLPNPAGRNKRTVWTVATAPFSAAHFACVDTETECLTIGGWRRYHEIKPGDQIFTYNMETEGLELQPVQQIATYPYKGDMVSVFGRSSNMVMTPNHRCVVQRKHKKGGMRPPVIVTADKIKGGMKFPVAAILPDDNLLPPNDPVEFFELLGWISSEGEYHDTGSVELSQSLTANPQHVKRLDALCAFFGDDMRRHQRDRGEKGVVITYSIHKELRKRVLLIMPEKGRIPEHFLLLPSDYLQSFLDGFVGGDGHVRPDGRITIVQKEKQPLDLIQAMYIRLGKSCILSQRGNNMWTAYITNANSRYFKNAKSSLIRDDYSYHGVVWCPVVENTTWVARRGGRPFITGNTFPPKLIEPCILAGCPPKVCVDCGAGWARVVEKSGGTIGQSWHDHNNDQGRGQRGGDDGHNVAAQLYNTYRISSTGWQPTCECGNAATIPGIVLDPFMGAGTVALVAIQHGRRWMGSELNPEYIKIAEDRISAVQVDMFTSEGLL